MDIRYFDTLESTNLYCKLLDPDSVEEFTVICARTQTAGIGQPGNVWVSQPGANLTFSLILKPSFLAAADQYELTMMLAVAVAESVSQRVGTHPVAIKWPNDIYVGDKKICGILTTGQIHNTHLSQAICGVGLNVNQTTFPAWVPDPTSLKILTGTDHDIEGVLGDLLRQISLRYEQLKSDAEAIRTRYLQLLYRKDREASYETADGIVHATITGVDRFGHLLLRRADGTAMTCDIKTIRFII